MNHLTPETWGISQWAIAIIAAILIGLSKSGFGGVGTVFVLLMASIMASKASTGFILPLLIVGDILAVGVFRQHANWLYIRRLLPTSMLGVIVGFFLMDRVSETLFKPLIGGLVLVLCGFQIARLVRESWFARLENSRSLGVFMGSACGVSTMLSNNSGPIASWYFLASGLPKMELVGTAAWFFLILNVWKLPWSYGLGLINFDSLRFGLFLVPAVPIGVFAGRWILTRISQKTFEWLLLIFSFVAALRLMFL